MKRFISNAQARRVKCQLEREDNETLERWLLRPSMLNKQKAVADVIREILQERRDADGS